MIFPVRCTVQKIFEKTYHHRDVEPIFFLPGSQTIEHLFGGYTYIYVFWDINAVSFSQRIENAELESFFPNFHVRETRTHVVLKLSPREARKSEEEGYSSMRGPERGDHPRRSRLWPWEGSSYLSDLESKQV